MAWRRIGDKPLSEPMMALFTDAYMRHSASMSYSNELRRPGLNCSLRPEMWSSGRVKRNPLDPSQQHFSNCWNSRNQTDLITNVHVKSILVCLFILKMTF